MAQAMVPHVLRNKLVEKLHEANKSIRGLTFKIFQRENEDRTPQAMFNLCCHISCLATGFEKTLDLTQPLRFQPRCNYSHNHMVPFADIFQVVTSPEHEVRDPLHTAAGRFISEHFENGPIALSVSEDNIRSGLRSSNLKTLASVQTCTPPAVHIEVASRNYSSAANNRGKVNFFQLYGENLLKEIWEEVHAS